MDLEERGEFERSLRHVVEQNTGAELDAALDDLGWTDALTMHTPEAVSILFEQQGFGHRSSSALDKVVVHALGLDVRTNFGVVWPEFGRWDQPGTIEANDLVVSGLAQRFPADRDSLVVVTRWEDRDVAFQVPVPQLNLRPLRGIDVDLELVEVTGRVNRDALSSEVAIQPWASSVALAQLALAHELVGLARKMLELARQHAVDRIQFGQSISKFQAVRHRLAETLVAIESADAVLAAGWEDGSSTTASVAKALAGRGARTTARHCQQVLAGIGFTTEHEFHLYVRRALVLDGLYGTARSHTRQFGTELIATRLLPEFAPL